MEYIVAAFRSRSETVKFSYFLKNHGLSNEIVNTPKEAGVGCGLSVKVNKLRFNELKRAVRIANLSSFAGFFSVYETAGKKIIRPIS